MPTWYDGNVTWYDLCNGSNGACGNCNDQFRHIAWSHLTTTGCLCNCANIPKVCGDVVQIIDACSSTAWWGVIKDCCPCSPPKTGCSSGQLPSCSMTSRCNGAALPVIAGFRTPLADLTTAYFLDLHGNLDDGRIPAWIYA